MDTVYIVRPPARYPEGNYVVSARSTYEAALRDVRDWLVRERDGRVGKYEPACTIERYANGERVGKVPVRGVRDVDDALERMGVPERAHVYRRRGRERERWRGASVLPWATG